MNGQEADEARALARQVAELKRDKERVERVLSEMTRTLDSQRASLRDRFAMQALSLTFAPIAGAGRPAEALGHLAQSAAMRAYEIADAMLVERERRSARSRDGGAP